MKAARLSALLIAARALSAAGALVWQPDFGEASKLAKDGKQDFFVFVNGSDWSAAARAYKKTVIQSPVLEQAFGKAFVWLEVDRPDRATAEQKAAAQKNKGFEVVLRNYPGVALLDADGRCYLKLEAPQGGVDALVAAVKQARALKDRRDATLERAAKATGVERAKLLGAALEGMGDYALQNGRHSHRALLDEIKKLDPQDAAGTLRRLTFNPDALAERELWPLVNEKKYAEALALVDKELKDARNNLWLRQHLLGLRFYVFQSQERLDEAVQTLKQIIQADASTDMAKLARGYIDNLTQPVILSEPKWKPEHLRAHFADWRLDVSGLIREKGAYEIEFRCTDGDSLTVRDVALHSGSRELAKAAPSGHEPKVELDVKSLPAGQKLWLLIAAKGQGWFSGRGDIVIRKK